MRYYAAWLCRFTACDPKQFEYPNVNAYCYCENDPINKIDPDGRAVRPANAESFNVLLSSLPAEARSIIVMDDNNFIDLNSVNEAYSQFSDSGNLQALRDIVADERVIDFYATETSYNFFNVEEGKNDKYDFQPPDRSNVYQELLSLYDLTEQEKQLYAQQLIENGFLDEITVTGDFGVALRPFNEQQPYPGGSISLTDNFQVYINPVGTTPTEKAINVGHELFGHIYMFFMGKDPRHTGGTGKPDGNPILEKQIGDRERESEFNFNH